MASRKEQDMVKQWIQKWVSGWRTTPGVAPSGAGRPTVSGPVPSWQVPAYQRRQRSGDRCGR
ncbi:hypothetical protein [Hydrogenophaga soli]